MGISCKPVGKFESTMRKLQNQLDKQEKAAKVVNKKAKGEKKEDKKGDDEE